MTKILGGAYPYITVDLKSFSSGPPVMAAFQTNSVDAAIHMGELPTINALANGTPIRIVDNGGWAQHSLAFVVPVHSNIQSLQDLKGKTVAVQLGSSLEEFAGSILKLKAGLSLSDLKVVNMQPTDAAVALQAGKLDAAALDNGPYHKLVQSGFARVLADAGGTDWAITQGEIMGQQFMKDHPVEARRLVEAFILAEKFEHEHAAMAAALLAKDSTIGVDYPTALLTVEALPTYPVITDPKIVGVYQRIADYDYAKGVLSSQPDYAKNGYIDTSFYKQATARIGSWPYAFGSANVVVASEQNGDIDSALKPYIDQLKKSDPVA